MSKARKAITYRAALRNAGRTNPKGKPQVHGAPFSAYRRDEPKPHPWAWQWKRTVPRRPTA